MKESKISIQSLNQVEKENYWKEVIEDFERSNLTRTAYCRKYQIKYDNFSYWYKRNKKPSISQLIPIKIEPTSYQSNDKGRVISTLQLKNGCLLSIYDKETLLIILSKVI